MTEDVDVVFIPFDAIFLGRFTSELLTSSNESFMNSLSFTNLESEILDFEGVNLIDLDLRLG